MVLGQDRKYIAALVVPNLDILLTQLKKRGIDYDESKVKYGVLNGLPVCIEVGEDVIDNELVQKAVQEEIDKINAQLEDHETIKKFKVLNRRLTEEAGEVTASQKLRMQVVKDKYQDDIESLYR